MKRTLKKYDDFDVVRVFLAVGEAGLVKRMDVCYRTLIGEGSIKSILGDLEAKGLVEIDKKGNKLTASGEDEFRKIKRLLSDIRPIRTDLFNDHFRAHGAVLKSYDSDKTNHIFQPRDHAIRLGCWSAMVLLYNKGTFQIPTLGIQEFGDLKDEIGLEDGDLVIAVSSRNRRDSEKGILSVAQYLNSDLDDMFSKISGRML